MVDQILDTAGQKGTGKWTSESALEEGIPLTLISEAVSARCVAARKEERMEASAAYGRKCGKITEDRKTFAEQIRKALYAAKIISYAQGYSLMKAAAEHYGWKLNYGDIALIWRGGWNIRSVFLGKIKEAYDANPVLANLLLDPYFRETMERLRPAWRKVAAAAIQYGVPMNVLRRPIVRSSCADTPKARRPAPSGNRIVSALRKRIAPENSPAS